MGIVAFHLFILRRGHAQAARSSHYSARAENCQTRRTAKPGGVRKRCRNALRRGNPSQPPRRAVSPPRPFPSPHRGGKGAQSGLARLAGWGFVGWTNRTTPLLRHLLAPSRGARPMLTRSNEFVRPRAAPRRDGRGTAAAREEPPEAFLYLRLVASAMGATPRWLRKRCRPGRGWDRHPPRRGEGRTAVPSRECPPSRPIRHL